MKALTLTQPWASLVAVGAKHVETRSWQTAYRGPIAIHAAKNLEPIGGAAGLMITCDKEPFRSALEPLRNGDFGGVLLPLGRIVAVAELIDVAPTGQLNFALRVSEIDWPELTERERAFGDFTPGRFGWLLADVRRVDPIEIPKGAVRDYRGLWDVPAEIEASLGAPV